MQVFHLQLKTHRESAPKILLGLGTDAALTRHYHHVRGNLHQYDGFLLRKRLVSPILSEFEDIFHTILERVQVRKPTLIEEYVDVRESYGISRSLRRGATAHSINQNVPAPIRDAINRWRGEYKSDQEGMVKAGAIADVYARLDFIAPTAVKFSASL